MFACLWVRVSLKYLSLCDDPFCVCAVVYLPDKWGIRGVTLHRKDSEEDGWFCIHGKESGSRKLTGSQGVPCAIGGSPVVMTLWTVVMETDLNRMPMEKNMSPGLFNETASSAAQTLVDWKVLKYRAVMKKTSLSAFAAVEHKTKTKNPAVKLVLLLIKTAADCRLRSPC